MTLNTIFNVLAHKVEKIDKSFKPWTTNQLIQLLVN